jgi:hypothetical protein
MGKLVSGKNAPLITTGDWNRKPDFCKINASLLINSSWVGMKKIRGGSVVLEEVDLILLVGFGAIGEVAFFILPEFYW